MFQNPSTAESLYQQAHALATSHLLRLFPNVDGTYNLYGREGEKIVEDHSLEEIIEVLIQIQNNV